MNIKAVYKKYKINKEIIEHSKTVARIAKIISNMVDLKIDKEILKNAALLHEF